MLRDALDRFGLSAYNPIMPRESRLVLELDRALMERQVAQGFALLDQSNSELARLKSSQQDAASIVVRVAQWVDLGYRDVDFLQQLLQRFPPDVPGTHDTQGLSATAAWRRLFVPWGKRTSIARSNCWTSCLQAEDELGDQRLAAIAHFWKGRSHRKKGEYDAAMAHVVKGRSLMQAIPAPKLAAVIQIQESWLLFQTGQIGRGAATAGRSQSATGRHRRCLSLGNIESAKGRMERHAGKYARGAGSFCQRGRVVCPTRSEPSQPGASASQCGIGQATDRTATAQAYRRPGGIVADGTVAILRATRSARSNWPDTHKSAAKRWRSCNGREKFMRCITTTVESPRCW